MLSSGAFLPLPLRLLKFNGALTVGPPPSLDVLFSSSLADP